MKSLRYLILFIVLLVSSTTGNAETITALDIVLADPFYYMPGNPITHGWAFTTNEMISVTHLGWFDGRGRGQTGQTGTVGDGLASNHPLAIWTSNGNLVVSSSVRTTNPLEDQFRYREISPTLLNANTTYIVAGLSLSGSSVRDAMASSSPAVDLDFDVDPTVTFVGGRIKSTSSQLEFPGNDEGPLQLGPNFKFFVVPEPSSLAICSVLVGFGIAIGLWRRCWR